ncbi:EAL domain-containing response regulator [Alkalimarinus alittae]|uniref:EAL domain-containing protein n=1 Tax=Alkalimarinus alittae TaxID=2961619 RepID=A0ABY6N4H3_9ALTE|nr:EAL domain-containing protein [Alkalimarinus alittae]UZE96892.1 EAL domain-containing protein [Alkalimarinus alittae]
MQAPDRAKKPLNALIIEDVEDDALLLVDYLETNDFSVKWCRVDTEEGMISKLKEPWDIVFSDFSMPHFSGHRALGVLREHNSEIPFIFVSGTIGEDIAVEALKSGAQDYLMKDNLVRMRSAVERELRETQSRKDRQKTDRSRARLVAILEASPDMVAILQPDARLEYLNSSGLKLLGLEGVEKEHVEKLNLVDLVSEPFAQQLWVEILPGLQQNKAWHGETEILTIAGKIIPVSMSLLAHNDRHGEIEYLSVTVRDISERKHFESVLHHQATHDALTGLPNRYFLINRFATALELARRHDHCVAVMFLDLDNFKRVNDSMGHGHGDSLLKQVSQRLRNSLRPGDTIARHGGDEFTILLENLKHPDKAISVIRKLREAFLQPIKVGSQDIYVTFSTGIALYPTDGQNVEDLLRNADTAMYRAKALGPSQYRFYAPSMNARGHEFLSLEGDLQQALEQNEFRLYYQPQVDAQSGKVVGMEGLIRWQHPKRGIVSPADFIPLLEGSGLIISVGEWVLRQACMQHRIWREAGFNDLRISVNVSATQFNDRHLMDKIQRAIKEEQMIPHLLELEITENTVMQDPVAVIETLNALRSEGVRIAIDDFGTGYSSLAYLKRFPLSVLKIDKSFVDDIGEVGGDSTIVEASISLAHKLGLQVVAEGVERVEQYEFLRSIGCDLIQGYYINRPLTEADMTDFLVKNATQ